jgi:hypothetical protein
MPSWRGAAYLLPARNASPDNGFPLIDVMRFPNKKLNGPDPKMSTHGNVWGGYILSLSN